MGGAGTNKGSGGKEGGEDEGPSIWRKGRRVSERSKYARAPFVVRFDVVPRDTFFFRQIYARKSRYKIRDLRRDSLRGINENTRVSILLLPPLSIFFLAHAIT